IFAFISRYEGFGLPILESFSAGTPVVAANSSSLPEVAGDAAILVNPEETDEIVEAFQKIVDNPKMAKDLIEKGRERIKIFSWDNTARKILKCLEEM
ncbi:MAG TPA: glycosyltransferase, partial [bacterium]|nr:glycosyltransferase [bacterium]